MNCWTMWRGRFLKGCRDEPRADFRSRPSRPHGIADAETRREPEIFRRRDGHDHQRPQRGIDLSARLGRLRALFPKTDTFENFGNETYGPALPNPPHPKTPG